MCMFKIHCHVMRPFVSSWWLSDWYSATSSRVISEFVRNVGCQAPLQTYQIKICILTRSPSVSHDHESLKSAGVQAEYYLLLYGPNGIMAQMIKSLPAIQETWVQSLGWEDPLEEGMAIHSSILAWEIPWTEKPGGLQSLGSCRIRNDSATNTHTHTHTRNHSHFMGSIFAGKEKLLNEKNEQFFISQSCCGPSNCVYN